MPLDPAPFSDAQSAAALREFFDSVPLAVVMLTEDDAIIALNISAQHIFGAPSEPLLGAPSYRLLADPSLERGLRDDGIGGDYTGRRDDGSTFPFRAVFSQVRVMGLTLTAVIIDDLTERRQMERTLRESEERATALLEGASDVVYTHDMQGNFTWVNEAGVALYGYGLDELLRLNIADIVDPVDLSRAAARMAERVAGDESIPFTVLTRAKDGTAIWLEVTSRVLRNDTGAAAGVQGIARDATQRVRAEEELRRTNDFRDRVMSSTRNAIAALDNHGQLTLVNKRAEQMTGYSADELVGSHLTMLFPPEDRERIVTEFADALGDGEAVIDYELELLRKDGGRVAVLFNAGPLIEDGKTVGFAGTAEDITERKRAETLLAGQRHLLEMVAVDAPAHDVLCEIIRMVELHAQGSLCSILVVNDDGTSLRSEAALSLPREYCDALQSVPIGPDEGSCGSAAYTVGSVVAVDVRTDPSWAKYRHLAESAGLRSCWSTPILSSTGVVLGTFAVYRREPGAPGDQEQELVQIATHVAGIALERKNAKEAVRDRARELERLYSELVEAHEALEDSKARLEDKSGLLEVALVAERERARRDPLTGALNHAAITDVMRDRIANADERLMAIAMVDVDGLKAANDTYGHQIGDAVLRAVSECLDRDGAIVGRYGGDEFVAVLPGADRAAGERYREAVMTALAERKLVDPDTGARVPLVMSMGLAMYPEEAQAVDDLIKLSDSAMYAQRRHRAAAAGAGVSRMLGSDRAAKMIGEIVPFLTSPGDVEEKLRLVAMRLSIGAGYDAVSFTLYGSDPSARSTSNSYSESEGAFVDAWDQESHDDVDLHPLRPVFERTRRPIIIDDMACSNLIPPFQRNLLARAGLLSGVAAPMIWQGEVVGALSVASKRSAAFGPQDAQFIGAVASQVSSIVRTAALVDELQEASSQLLQAHTETVLMLAGAAEAHDATTGRHLQRVHALTEALAIELGHDAESAKEMGLAAVLHDIGKIRVPDYVLSSADSLGDNEWALMKQHTVWGGAFLGGRRGFELASQVARAHHERWDGTGYPDGLVGDAIPETAAITSVADSVDAMTSDRPYRKGRPIAEAVTEVQAWSGRQFSPRVVEALVRLYERGELSVYLDDHRAHDDDDALAA